MSSPSGEERSRGVDRASTTAFRQREEERRLSIRTLAIAAIASAAAAVVTSRFWIAGTPIAAALTPVIVALVSELLHRPTTVIADRLTTDRTAVLRPEPEAGPRDREDDAPPITVYRRPQEGRRPRRRVAVGIVLATGALAFAIAAAALTVPELIAGGSLGKGDRDTTIFGGRDRGEPRQDSPLPQTVPEGEPAPAPEPAETETAPTETTPTETETTPTETETAP